MYLLNDLLQMGQENCIGPTKICAGVGIQNLPWVLKLEKLFLTLIISSFFTQTLMFPSAKLETSPTFGSPMCKPTSTFSIINLPSSLISKYCLSWSRTWPLSSFCFIWSFSTSTSTSFSVNRGRQREDSKNSCSGINPNPVMHWTVRQIKPRSEEDEDEDEGEEEAEMEREEEEDEGLCGLSHSMKVGDWRQKMFSCAIWFLKPISWKG